jgi:hypothetical protein
MSFQAPCPGHRSHSVVSVPCQPIQQENTDFQTARGSSKQPVNMMKLTQCRSISKDPCSAIPLVNLQTMQFPLYTLMQHHSMLFLAVPSKNSDPTPCRFLQKRWRNSVPSKNGDVTPFLPKTVMQCCSFGKHWRNAVHSKKLTQRPSLQTCWHNTIPPEKAHTMPFLRNKVMQHGSCRKGLRNAVLSENADEVPFLLKKLMQCRSFGKGSRCTIPLVIALQCCSFGKGSHNTIPLDKSHTIPFLCKHHCW